MYWLIGMMGILSLVSPLLFGYMDNFAALWTSVGVGAVLLVVSFLEGLADDKQMWEYWLAGLLGIVAIAAPFIFGFSAITAAVWTSVVIGLITVIVAGAKLTSGNTRLLR